MGKGRDKRRRKAKKKNEQTRGLIREMAKPDSDPPILDEPDALVPAPLKPTPHLRSGAIAVAEPEYEFVVLKP
jgi:hypothetical protein